MKHLRKLLKPVDDEAKLESETRSWPRIFSGRRKKKSKKR